jgi:hypothetical protein
MQSVEAHAKMIAESFPGFNTGVMALRKDTSKKIVAVVTVFNRIVNEDPGLRFKIDIPVSGEDRVGGIMNIFGKTAEEAMGSREIMISRSEYGKGFTVRIMAVLTGYDRITDVTGVLFAGGRFV